MQIQMELKKQTPRELSKELKPVKIKAKIIKIVEDEKTCLEKKIISLKQRIAMAEMNGNQEEYDRLTLHLIKIENGNWT